jgi:ABC-type branched-subunit amino acid transport system ATPase component
MSQKKRKAKLLQIAEFHAEARRLAGNLSANQRRVIEVGFAHGKELEPSGWLAGGALARNRNIP